jgi:CheY-like chemotaxis protein
VAKPKLLLADDSVTIRKVVELTFADEGLDVTTVSTGEEAMQKLAEIQPDIVIADVNMPEPTGYQICESIKQNDATKHIPVLLVVGSFEPFDQNEAERVGADGFLTKPFQSIRDLINRVNELLGTDSRPTPPAEIEDIESLYEKSFDEQSNGAVVEEFAGPVIEEAVASQANDAGGEMPLGDAGMDDEIIEMSYPSGDGRIVAASIAADASVNPIQGSVDDTHDIEMPREKNDDVRHQSQTEPSEEFVALVARRVVEKLSDKVIREIAKEAVPRIAEKLIREALEEDKKH